MFFIKPINVIPLNDSQIDQLVENTSEEEAINHSVQTKKVFLSRIAVNKSFLD